jgi:hypothetical protein
MEPFTTAVSRVFRSNTRTDAPNHLNAEVVPAEAPRKSRFARCCEGLLGSREHVADPFQHLTLEAIRADRDLYERFRQFAANEASLENLDFLELCSQFAQRHDLLPKIIKEHVQSERTNISGPTRLALIQQWQTSPGDFGDPRWPVLLSAANDEVTRLVRDNTLARFKDWLAGGDEAPRGPVSVTLSGPRRLSQVSQEKIAEWERRQSEVARRASTASTASNASDASAGLLTDQSSPSEHAIGPSPVV